VDLNLHLIAAEAAASKTMEPTVVIEVGPLMGITDFFVVTGGRNDRQVRSIVDEVTSRIRAAGGGSVRRVEGLQAATWVLLDYGDFVVHVFDAEAREYFALERLWADAPRVEWESQLSSEAASS
jgi:ribosome-associated protein